MLHIFFYSRHQKHYSETDINYFFLLLKEIITNENYCIRPIVALNLISQLKEKSFTKDHAEKLIDEWMNIGYFIDHNTMIYFGPKILAEFASYFKRNFSPYLKDCELCKNTVFWVRIFFIY